MPSARNYEPGTNTLATTWRTQTGWALVRDTLAMGPRKGEDTITPHTRPPTDEDGEHLLVRTALCLEGRVEMELVCEPDFDYGTVGAEWSPVGGPSRGRRERTGPDHSTRDEHGAGDRGQRGSRAAFDRAGRGRLLLTVMGRGARVAEGLDDANGRVAAPTSTGGRIAGARRSTTLRAAIERSALAIKGLTFMPTGATVAALTTSLPETPGGERNWDYRYTWIRDSTFTLQALHFLSLDWEAEEFMQFIGDLEPDEDGALQIMYGIDGRRDLTESTRDDLSGYAGAHRSGSATGRSTSARTTSTAQRSTRSCCTPATASGCPAPVADRSAQAQCATTSGQPDQGIWEARGNPSTTSPRS